MIPHGIKKSMTTDPNKLFFYMQSEDLSVTEYQLQVFKTSEFACCSMAIVCIFSGMVSTDLSLSSPDDSPVLLLAMSSLCTLCLLIGILWRTFRELRWLQAKGIITYLDGLRSTKKVLPLIFELVINSIHPFYGIEEYYFEVHCIQLNRSIRYSYNGILSLFVVIKFYHVVRFVAFQSRYASSRSQRLCNMNGRVAGTFYATKCLIKEEPLFALPFITFSSFTLLAYLLFIAEQPLEEFDMNSFSDFSNAVWCIIITMTTVGYGDFIPVTDLGRVTVFFTAIFGICFLPIIVVSITHIFHMIDWETKSLSIIRRLEVKKEMRARAAMLITTAVKYNQIAKKQYDPRLALSYFRKFRKAMNLFKKAKIKMFHLHNNHGFHERLDARLAAIEKQFLIIEEKKQKVKQFFQ